MRAKFKVLLGERLCEKAFGVNLGEFGGSKSAFVSDESHKNAFMNEFKNSKSAFACEFNGSKSAFVSDESYKSTLTNEVKSLKNALASKIKNSKSAFVSDKGYKSTLINEVKGSKNAFACEFDSHENAVASQKGALMSAFKTHLSELKRAFASHKGIFLDKCQKGEFESKRVKKNFGVGISLSLSR